MSKEETNKQVVQLTAAMDVYFKRATELGEQRAKEARELDEKRAKADEKEINEIILKQLLPMHALYI